MLKFSDRYQHNVPPIEKFMRSILVGDECWEWQAGRSGDGYGWFYAHGEHISAHRFSYATFVGELSSEEQVLHKCDNPPCVRPGHLYKGTYLDNVADKVARRRVAETRNANNILTESQVLEIWDRYHALSRKYGAQSAMAREFRISPAQVKTIVTARQWRHLLRHNGRI